jgi:hypothetical protein
MDAEESLRWLTAAVAVVLIVLLVLFARGPEDQDRSGAALPGAAALAAA